MCARDGVHDDCLVTFFVCVCSSVPIFTSAWQCLVSMLLRHPAASVFLALRVALQDLLAIAAMVQLGAAVRPVNL